MPEGSRLTAEDAKLVTLARSARPRSRVTTARPQGAAVRDETGRTYQAARVEVAGLDLSALRLALAMALSSGATAFEAAAVVLEAADAPEAARGPGVVDEAVGAADADAPGVAAADVPLLRSLAVPTLVVAAPDGTVRRVGPP